MNELWIEAFPFLSQQQTAVQALFMQHPDFKNYNVVNDWAEFDGEHEHIDAMQKFRMFRRSRLAYIAQKDFELPLGQHSVAMEKTSDLADLLLQKAFLLAQQQFIAKYGDVVDEEGEQIPFAVLALGKLGTKELNYSSDIDLVFVCGGDGHSSGEKSLDSVRYFERLGRLIIQLLDQYTVLGRVYRVDMRLRPFGSVAPLVCTAAALQHYIITEGREWERFAWMRARFVAGNKSLADAVLSSVNPFIYRKHLDYSVFDSLAKIKRDMSLSAEDHELDLKQGSGGIREIEFIVQSLQVTFGGRSPSLQGVSIGPQFELLSKKQKIKSANAKALSEAWLFLRRLENLCQIQNDEQTHVMPNDSGAKEVFAQVMGFQDWKGCQEKWQQHRRLVKTLFNALFVADDEPHPLSDDSARWVRRTMDQHFIQKMTQERADKMQKLLERACELETVDALEQGLLPILQVIARRPSYVLMLLQERNLLPSLLRLVGQNDYFVSAWVQYPALLELLFEPEIMPDVVDVAFYEAAWLDQDAENMDDEQWMESVRYFKHKQQFKLIQTALTMALSDSYLRSGFSALADFFVALVVKKGWYETRQRLGDCGLEIEQMMVLAYGSLGVSNLGVNSDLDLVLVVDKQNLDGDQLTFLQRWAKRISHHLMVKMYNGVLYNLDLQLRPNGNAGALVTGRIEFENYQREQAWVWEHAALIKARLLGSNKAQQAWFQSLKHKLLCHPKKTADEISLAMKEMANKLTQFGSQNHRNELLFLEQLLIALPGSPELLEEKNYKSLLIQSVKKEVITQELADSLMDQKSPI